MGKQRHKCLATVCSGADFVVTQYVHILSLWRDFDRTGMTFLCTFRKLHFFCLSVETRFLSFFLVFVCLARCLMCIPIPTTMNPRRLTPIYPNCIASKSERSPGKLFLFITLSNSGNNFRKSYLLFIPNVFVYVGWNDSGRRNDFVESCPIVRWSWNSDVHDRLVENAKKNWSGLSLGYCDGQYSTQANSWTNDRTFGGQFWDCEYNLVKKNVVHLHQIDARSKLWLK